jgi:hypothetical protein
MPGTEHTASEENTAPKVVQGELVLPRRDIEGVYSSAPVSEELREHMDRIFDDMRAVKRPIVGAAPITVEGKVIRKSTEADSQ